MSDGRTGWLVCVPDVATREVLLAQIQRYLVELSRTPADGHIEGLYRHNRCFCRRHTTYSEISVILTSNSIRHRTHRIEHSSEWRRWDGSGR